MLLLQLCSWSSGQAADSRGTRWTLVLPEPAIQFFDEMLPPSPDRLAHCVQGQTLSSARACCIDKDQPALSSAPHSAYIPSVQTVSQNGFPNAPND